MDTKRQLRKLLALAVSQNVKLLRSLTERAAELDAAQAEADSLRARLAEMDEPSVLFLRRLLARKTIETQGLAQRVEDMAARLAAASTLAAAPATPYSALLGPSSADADASHAQLLASTRQELRRARLTIAELERRDELRRAADEAADRAAGLARFDGAAPLGTFPRAVASATPPLIKDMTK